MALHIAAPIKTVPHCNSFVIPNTFRDLGTFSTLSKFPNIAFSSIPRHRSHSKLCLHPCASMVTSTKKLSVTIHRSSLVTPAEETERKPMFLSTVDLTLNFKIGTVFFFPKNSSFPPETVVKILETAFRKTLVYYDYMAGRLKPDQNGRLEIDCNCAGAGFIVASSELSLEDLGDLISPRPDCQKLAARKLNGFHAYDQPLVIIQITSFKCGGFSMGVTFNHMIFDGIGYKIFLENLASIAGNGPLVLAPQNNRRLLAARSPPRVSFSHPQYINLDNNSQDLKSKMAPLSSSFKNIQSKAFHLTAGNMNNLKKEAKTSEEGNNIQMKVTDNNVVLAHIWRCIALSKTARNGQEKTRSLLFSINMRRRLKPRLSSAYTGNAICNAYCTATSNELKVGPFSRLVQLITQADNQLTDEYMRSSIDWGELHKGYFYADILVSSWWKLGYTDTIYPWGKPKWNSPVLQNHGNNAVILLPDIEGTSGKGVNIIVSLAPKEMQEFQVIFDTFLANITD